MNQTIKDMSVEGDIICVIPWQCGDKDCEAVGTWHSASYWGYSDDTHSVDHFSDGDHEDVDEIPSMSEWNKARLDYATYCAETGIDPLHEYTIPYTKQSNHTFYVQYVKCVAGYRLVASRRNKNKWEDGLNAIPEKFQSHFDVVVYKTDQHKYDIYTELFEATRTARIASSEHEFDVERSGHMTLKIKGWMSHIRSTKAITKDVQRVARDDIANRKGVGEIPARWLDNLNLV